MKLSPFSRAFKLSPGPVQNSTLTVYAVGTAYSLTNTAALLNFGTTDPSLTITEPGTYLILSRAELDYNGATFAASRTVTLKLPRTNNTAADLTNGTLVAKTEIVTTVTATMGDFGLPPVIYTTANNNDIIQIFGDVDTVPTAGSLDASSAEIIAIRLN